MHDVRVMIVEDEGLIAEDIALQLKDSGYAVECIAASGEEALAHLDTSLPDLVLMDIRLKGELDGIDTAMRIRTAHRLPVIMLTAHADSDTVARAKHAEPAGYLVKPFRQVNLCCAIEMAIQKHKSELALKEREAWLSDILQSTAHPTVVVDPNGLVQFLNRSAESLLKCELPQVIGSSWTAVMPLFSDKGQPIDDTLLLETCDHGHTTLLDGLLLHKQDGSEVTVECELSRGSSSNGVAGVIVTIRDVSQRNEQEAKFLHEKKMLALGRLAGGVAHDFNNLLTIIVGHLSLLADEATPSDRHSRVAMVLDAANTAVSITDQLLTLSGNHVRETEVLDVNARVQHLLRLATPGLASNTYKVLDLDGSTGPIRLNAIQFDQMILNLVMNARAAMPSGGTITIATSNLEKLVTTEDTVGMERFVRLLVKNSGEAIAPEVKEHLFEPFFNFNSNGIDEGFGLSIVYSIVKSAGGQISVENIKGGGTCFEVLLPLVEVSPRSSVPSSLAATKDAVVKTILLAEDDSIIRQLVREFLEQQGYHLIVAESGEAALGAAENYEGHIDLLLSDFRMPNMDGLTLSERISASRPDTKILLMSGYTGDSAKFSLEGGMALAFIQKPFMPLNLLQKIQGLTA